MPFGLGDQTGRASSEGSGHGDKLLPTERSAGEASSEGDSRHAGSLRKVIDGGSRGIHDTTNRRRHVGRRWVERLHVDHNTPHTEHSREIVTTQPGGVVYVGGILRHMARNDREAGPATAALAAAIREVQGARDVSTAELSRRSSVPYSTLRKIRSGDQPIDWEELTKIAKALEIRISELAARTESGAPR